MRVEILPDAEAVAARGAREIAEQAQRAAAARGRFLLAVSGGSTPWRLFERLAGEALPWPAVELLQVDERLAPRGDPERNWTGVERHLLARVPLAEPQLHPMPVDAGDPEAAARAYQRGLETLAGAPPVLDCVQLGLGEDGHTASLVPGDAALEATTAVALTASYRGRRRMTLTLPVLDAARSRVWIVTGAAKAPALARLRAGDRTLPAGRVNRDALLFADRAAAGEAPGARAPR